MATHGSILLKLKRQRVFLHTTHDGHANDALRMVLNLPAYVADNVWLPKIIKLTKEDVRDIVDQHAGGGFEWTIHEVATALTRQHWNRWLIIPNNEIKHLAPWGQTPSFTVDLGDLDSVKITELDQELVENPIDLTDYPGAVARGDCIWSPFWQQYLDYLVEASAKKYKR